MPETALIIIGAILFATNLVCFILMAADKRRARRGRWRLSEKTLFISAACFGALGGVFGMQLCRHKTKHTKFKVLFPLMLIVQTAAIVWVLVRFYK